uniref:Uncharacterized protein n=1 Tax=Astatotilapia calliptera TaxID=8154 RepID=A0AAX7TSJ2_ASTCA
MKKRENVRITVDGEDFNINSFFSFLPPPLVPTPPPPPLVLLLLLPPLFPDETEGVSMTTLCRPVRGGSEAGVPGRKGPHLADHLSMSTA